MTSFLLRSSNMHLQVRFETVGCITLHRSTGRRYGK